MALGFERSASSLGGAWAMSLAEGAPRSGPEEEADVAPRGPEEAVAGEEVAEEEADVRQGAAAEEEASEEEDDEGLSRRLAELMDAAEEAAAAPEDASADATEVEAAAAEEEPEEEEATPEVDTTPGATEEDIARLKRMFGSE